MDSGKRQKQTMVESKKQIVAKLLTLKCKWNFVTSLVKQQPSYGQKLSSLRYMGP